MSLDIKTEERGSGGWTLALSGRLDSETAGQCEQVVNDVLTREASVVVFDMKNLDYISSAGLRVILETRKQLEKGGGKIVTANMQAPVAKVFELAGILGQTEIFESEESADIYLDAVQRREAMKNFDVPDE
jgi:anti-anti-sigma factor